MLNYDEQAATYDATRGGVARAVAAAEALDALAPRYSSWLDIGGGTGSVAEQLRDRGHAMFVLDRSRGVLGVARRRGCTCLVADATAIPVVSGSLDVVSTIWLLHLLADVEPVIAEVARVLSGAGTWFTTVDKALSHGRHSVDPPDGRGRIDRLAGAYGLQPIATTTFVGHGQGRDDAADPVFTCVAYRGSP